MGCPFTKERHLASVLRYINLLLLDHRLQTLCTERARLDIVPPSRGQSWNYAFSEQSEPAVLRQSSATAHPPRESYEVALSVVEGHLRRLLSSEKYPSTGVGAHGLPGELFVFSLSLSVCLSRPLYRSPTVLFRILGYRRLWAEARATPRFRFPDGYRQKAQTALFRGLLFGLLEPMPTYKESPCLLADPPSQSRQPHEDASPFTLEQRI